MHILRQKLNTLITKLKPMKKSILFLFVLCLLGGIKVNAQSPACLTAGYLSPKSYPSQTSVDSTMQLTATETWFKVLGTSDSSIFKLTTFITGHRNRIDKIEVYKGPNCSSLTFLGKDSLESNSDSTLFLSAGNYTSTDTLYVRTTYINNPLCPSCAIASLDLRLQMWYLSSVQVSCPTCTTMTGCNLVCNGNFETYNGFLSTPQNGNVQDACGWSSFTNGSCDYFNTANPNLIRSVPCNAFGYETPHGGNGYAGFASWPGTPSLTNYSEYMKTKLLYPLAPGNSYTVSFYVSLGDEAAIGTGEIGIYFFDDIANVPVSVTGTNEHLSFPPTIPILTNTVSKSGWTLVSGSFTTPLSGPLLKWMVIGGFTGNYPIISCTNNTGGCGLYNCTGSETYMYIDDVSVTGKILKNEMTIQSCPFKPVTLTTSLTPPVSWTNVPGSPTTTTVTVTPGAPSTTYVATSFSGTCPETEIFHVINSISPNETITIAPSLPYVCSPTGTINLTASGLSNGIYNWQNPGGPLIVPSSPTQTYTYGQNVQSQMIASGIAANGCPTSQTVNIIPVQTPSVSVNSPAVCANAGTTTLTAVSSPSAPISWSTGQTGNTISISIPATTTVYTVTANGPGTCDGTATSTVTVNPMPSITSAFSLTPTVTCINTPVTADAVQTTPLLTLYNFTYNFGDPGSPGNIVSNTNSAAVTHSYATPGTYTVTLTATATSLNGCVNTSVTTHTVQILNLPSDIAINGLQQTTCEAASDTVQTNIAYNPNYTYSWAITSGTGATVTPQAQPNQAVVNFTGATTNITVCLTISLGNCSFTACKSSMYCCPGGAGITVLTNPNISSAAMLPAGNYVVNGTLTVANPTVTPMTWTGVNLTMNPFSQIIFSGTNQTLNINSSHLHGCTSMWEGIKILDNGATLNTSASLLEDAQKGIYVFKKGTLNAGSTWFNKNRIGVELSQTTFPISFTGCCFVSSTTPSLATVAAALPTAYGPGYQLTKPYTTSSTLTNGNPEIGLNIIACANNSVNFTNRSLYQYVHTGIYVTTTGLNINYANFQRIGQPAASPVGCTGIKVVGINNQTAATPFPTMKIVNIGDKTDPTKKCNFNNCMNGVWWTLGTVGDIATNIFTVTSNDAIHIEDHGNYVNAPAGYATEQISVLGNKITNVMRRGVFVYNYYTNRVRIAENQINNSNASYKAATAIEAELFTGTNPSANNLWINDNNGVDAYGHTFGGIGIQGMYNGIRVVGYSQAHISGNKLETYPAAAPGSGGDFAAGIFVINNVGTTVSNNTLRNTTSSAGYAWWLYGIIGESSPNSVFFCNDIADIGVPMQMKGAMPCDIDGNDIQNGLTGLWLAINGFVGDQGSVTIPQDNKWGTFVNGAFLSGQTLDTYSSGDGAGNFFSTGSRLYYRNTNPTVWFPQNNGIQSAASTAFLPQLINTALQPPVCSTPGMQEGGGEEQNRMIQNADLIINEDVDFGENNVNAQYMLKQELYKNLRPLNELRENDPELSDFYNGYNGTSYDKMYVVDSLASLHDSSNAVLANVINAEIEQSTDIEQTQVALNHLVISKALTGSFSEDAYVEARAIAVLCPFTHGRAVYQARAILSAVDTIRYMNECEIPGIDFVPGGERLLGAITAKSDIAPLIGLYPNPANTSVTLVLRENEDAVTVEIVNLLGEKQEIKANKTGPGIVQVNTTNLANGTYLCKIYMNGILCQNEKLVIIK
jgi:hypothetical protein